MAGGGGDLCRPSPEHNRTIHHEPPDHGPMSGDRAVPWSKVLKAVGGTKRFGSGGCTSVSFKGDRGVGGGIEGEGWVGYWNRDRKMRRGE